jgi:hypothetical protein
MIRKGTIEGFSGTWDSDLGYLVIDGTPIPCENAPTVQALDRMFGDVIGPGHTVNDEALRGKRIVY